MGRPAVVNQGRNVGPAKGSQNSNSEGEAGAGERALRREHLALGVVQRRLDTSKLYKLIVKT